MRGIRSSLWVADDADGAVELYTSLFEDSAVGDRLAYTEAGQGIHGREPGSTMTIEFSLAGRQFIALEGGPAIRMNPSISLAVACPSPEEVDRLHDALVPDGRTLMEPGSYDWAQRYCWIEDRWGLSWQITYPQENAPAEKAVAPSFLFVGDVYRRGQEALEFYTSVFENSRIEQVVRNEEGEAAGTVLWSQFALDGETYSLMENGDEHEFAFGEGYSLMVECESQEEIDHYWEALGKDSKKLGPCGWLQDRFGVAWQVAPVRLNDMLRDGNPDQVRRVTDCFMKMEGKLGLPELEAVYSG